MVEHKSTNVFAVFLQALIVLFSFYVFKRCTKISNHKRNEFCGLGQKHYDFSLIKLQNRSTLYVLVSLNQQWIPACFHILLLMIYTYNAIIEIFHFSINASRVDR